MERRKGRVSASRSISTAKTSKKRVNLNGDRRETSRMIASGEKKVYAPSGSNEKIAGVMIPLFSIRTEANFGIGEILDLIPMIDWMADHHLRVLQVLPIHEMAPSETSPYKALSSFAIDPVYLSVQNWPDIQKNPLANHALSSPAVQESLEKWRASREICYGPIRALKLQLLQHGFHYFKEREWDKQTERATAFQSFMDQKQDWLNEYALFRLLKEKENWRPWVNWPPSFQNRDPSVLKGMTKDEEDRLLFFKYVQWVLWEQWRQVRECAGCANILIMGDLPFLVSQDSADVWCRQSEFSRDLSVGAPPDDFNALGQKWGLPLFHWDEMKRNELSWWRLRIREASGLYDLLRLDHVVGFFRAWVILEESAPYFDPSEEAFQIARGKAVLQTILHEAGEMVPIAEDLGLVPDFVRQTLESFQIGGHKVLRWERFGVHYKDPKDYPFLSLATTGTHDTTTLLKWWEKLPLEDRKHFLKMLDGPSDLFPETSFSDLLHQRIIDRIMGAGSRLVVLPIQDIFVQEDQINLPGTEGSYNWRYRIPLNLSELDKVSPYKERLAMFRNVIDRHGRYSLQK